MYSIGSSFLQGSGWPNITKHHCRIYILDITDSEISESYMFFPSPLFHPFPNKNPISSLPTPHLTNQPTNQPSNQATKQPSNQATKQPSNQATKQPSNQATNQPTNQPKGRLSSTCCGSGGIKSRPKQVPTQSFTNSCSTRCWISSLSWKNFPSYPIFTFSPSFVVGPCSKMVMIYLC